MSCGLTSWLLSVAMRLLVSSVVLDASALLAVMRNEPGADKVKAHLPGALICSVNLCEVFYKAMYKGAALEAVQWATSNLPIQSVPFDDDQAAVAASMHRATLKMGISFADRACLALGFSRELPVMTSDQNWTKLDVGVAVDTFR